MKNKMKFFQIYHDTYPHIEKLNYEQRGKLFTALYKFAVEGVLEEIDDPAADMALSFMSAQIKRDSENYNSTVEKRSRAGKLGGAPKGNKNAVKNSDKITENNLNNLNNQNDQEEKEEDKEKDKEEEKDIILFNDVLRYSDITGEFNRICVSFPKIIKLTDKRRRLIKNAGKLLGDKDFGYLFRKAEASDFLSGRDGSWGKCGFDWILNPSNMIKILEGNYDNKSGSVSYKNRYDEDF